MIIMGFNSLYPRSNYSGNYTIDVRIEAKLPTKWTHEKAEVGRAREEKRREEREEEERVRRKKMQVREKVGKSRFTAFFQWFVGPKGRKVGSLKRRVQSHLAKWEMKNCTPLWREAHLEVKKLKTPRVGSTFGSCDFWKVHAVVARSTFGSQNVQNTLRSEHFWKLRCSRSVRRCGAKHISKSECTKKDGRRGTFEADLQRWIERGRRSTRDMFIRDVRRSGRWFPETGCTLEHQIFRFAKMILRDRCST